MKESNFQIIIGDWRFSPDSAELFREATKVSLEHRSAMVLKMLADANGGVVSREDFVREIWNGRSVSENSVAVVIADLRRILGDQAREPQYIQTVPKRGYRLIADLAVPVHKENSAQGINGKDDHSEPRRRGGSLLAVLGLLAIVIVGAIWWTGHAPIWVKPVQAVEVVTFVNETQNPVHDPLSPAITDLVATQLSGYEGIVVANNDEPTIRVSGRLIMWSGHVAVSLYAEDENSGERIWSGMASGPEDKLPAQVKSEMKELADVLVSADNGQE